MNLNLKLPKIRLPSRDKAYDAISELAMLAGFLLFGYGLHMVYPPACFIVCGICIFIFGFPGRAK